MNTDTKKPLNESEEEISYEVLMRKLNSIDRLSTESEIESVTEKARAEAWNRASRAAFPNDDEIEKFKLVTQLTERQVLILSGSDTNDRILEEMGLKPQWREYCNDFRKQMISLRRKGRQEIIETMKVVSESTKEESNENAIRKFLRGNQRF